MRSTRRYGAAMKALGLMAVLALSPACVGLDIENTNAPDRDRALANSDDLEALGASTFNTFINIMHATAGPARLMPGYGTVATGTSYFEAFNRSTAEPRPPHENTTQITQSVAPKGPLQIWTALNAMSANSYDILRAISTGTTFGDADRTARIQAFALLMRGMAWGYEAMLYDKAVIIPETEALQSDIAKQGREALTPSAQALPLAIQSIEEAISVAQAHNFSFPSSSESNVWFTSQDPVSRAQFVQIANTVAARLLVLSARTPQERRQVDWAKVLAFTANGLTEDLRFQLGPGFRNSSLFSEIALATPGCANCTRIDYRAIGAADVSGQYQAWIGSPFTERRRFDIVTPDRRITGPTPQSHGSYILYRADDNGFNAQEGLWRFSGYQYSRHAIELGVAPAQRGHNLGFAQWISADENRLLRAEALLMTGDLQGAADLINVTRTRPQTVLGGTTYPGLPAVTAAGVPQSADCVPRTDQGACGDLYTALRYERTIELMFMDAVRAYADNRGFGMLADGTPLQFAPAEPDLLNMGLEVYTFGGVGNEFGAVYRPATYPF